ncbi:MAG TPA: hypothetical protein PK443_04070 [bacterium]|nr:hypothetical protein [bacterium]
MKKLVIISLILTSFSCINAAECSLEQLKQFHNFWNYLIQDVELLLERPDREKPVCQSIAYEDTYKNDMLPVIRSSSLAKKYCGECIDFCSSSNEAEKILIDNNYPDCDFFVHISIQRTNCSTYFGF